VETKQCLIDGLKVKGCSVALQQNHVFLFNKFHHTLISARKNKINAIFLKPEGGVDSENYFKTGGLNPEFMWDVE